MRLFVGIGLPDELTKGLASMARRALLGVKDSDLVRWTPPEDMHVTLSFLGSVEEARLEKIQQSLAAIHAARLDLRMNGIGVFANAGVLLAKVKPSAGLLQLAEQVFLAMESCGFEREERSYLPHVTLARIKRRSGGRPVSLSPSAGGDRALRQGFAASEFRLYQSVTRPEGAHYQVLKAFPLRVRDDNRKSC